jgi:hypothetical protein
MLSSSLTGACLLPHRAAANASKIHYGVRHYTPEESVKRLMNVQGTAEWLWLLPVRAQIANAQSG